MTSGAQLSRQSRSLSSRSFGLGFSRYLGGVITKDILSLGCLLILLVEISRLSPGPQGLFCPEGYQEAVAGVDMGDDLIFHLPLS